MCFFSRLSDCAALREPEAAQLPDHHAGGLFSLTVKAAAARAARPAMDETGQSSRPEIDRRCCSQDTGIELAGRKGHGDVANSPALAKAGSATAAPSIDAPFGRSRNSL